MMREKKKSKKLKIAAAVVLIIILIPVCAIAGFWAMGDAGEQADVIKETINSTTEDILASIDEEIDGTASVGDEGSAIVDSQEQDSLSGQGNNDALGDNEGAANLPASPKKAAVSQVEAAYSNAFARLQGEGHSIVNSLASSAKSDYDALKQAGKNDKTSLMKLASSYTKRADIMEKQMDSSVEVILDKMKSDMKNRGIDEKTINQYVKNYKAEYQAEKEATRSSMMKMAQGYL